MVYTKYIKRPLDVIFSIVLMILTSWLMLLLIVLYVITFHLPVFFVQQRIGKNNSIFSMMKFRTLKESEAGDRRFWLGNVLRFLSLDELPQLINVLKGNMSLIGPRPLPVEYLPLFSVDSKQNKHQR